MTVLRGLDVRMRLARLFCVTDARLAGGDLPAFAAAVSDAGVDLLQLRDDRASDVQKLAALGQLRTATQPNGLVSVYADCHLAREFGADVLHLPKGVPTAVKARGYVSQWAQLGRSCYSTEQVDEALADDGIDFLTLGPMYGRIPWLGPLPGLDLVRYAAQQAPPTHPDSKPWFAMGGITLDNLDEVVAAGARRIAVGRAIVEAADPADAAHAFAGRLRAAWADQLDEFTLGALASEGGGFRSVAGVPGGARWTMPSVEPGSDDAEAGADDDAPPTRSPGADDTEASEPDR